MIVANQLRSALSSWTDRLTALAVIAMAVAAVRSSLSDRPFIIAAAAVAVLAAAAGAGAARMIERRLDFHSRDGVMAADALDGGIRRHYILSVHAPVCGVVTACALIGRPATAVLAPIFYLAGAVICHLARRLVIAGGAPRRPSLLRPVRRLLQRPAAGAFAAIPAVLALLLLKSIEPGPPAAFVGLVGVVAALMLTMVDHDVVGFMSASGYRARRIIFIHARSLLIFLVPTVMASLALSQRLAAIVVCVVVLAALFLLTARILAYRVHSKRTADTLVTICAAVVCLAGIAMPWLLPLLVVAILWHLHRRSRAATWLLA